MSEANGLKSVIDTSLTSIKPRFDAISKDRIEALIRSQMPPSANIEITNVRGSSDKTGASSGIIIFTLSVDGVANDYVLRYAPVDNDLRIFWTYNIAGQSSLQHKLGRTQILPVADSLWTDPTGDILGLPGFIMNAVQGEVPYGSAFTGGLIGDATPDVRERLYDEVVRTQGRIHKVDWQALRLDEDVCSGPGRTPVERYVAWFWETSRYCPPQQLGRLERARQRILDQQPSYHKDDYCLIHGDTQMGNYMFRDEKIVAILDWELSGIILPGYDLAVFCNICEFQRAAATPDVAAIIPTTADWVARYERINGTTIRDLDFLLMLAAFSAAVVSLSMNRALPDEMKPAHLDMVEALWANMEN